MRTYLIGLFMVALGLPSFGQPQNSSKNYIAQFKAVAVQEMARSGIPASIILAQGILESSFGENELATQANNHFALKCNDTWEGEAIYKWNRDNIMACYKVFLSAKESFIEHTDRLVNEPSYGNLFYIPRDDYKKWAKGLERVQFSEMPKYAESLIQIIETFNLYELDESLDVFVKATVDNNEPQYKNNEDIYYPNGIKAIKAKDGETPLELAFRMNLPLRKVLKYNDLEPNQEFYPNQYVFLEKKKSKFEGERDFHTVTTRDNLYLISQTYGIKLKALRKYNHLELGEEPDVLEKIYLKVEAPARPKIRSKNSKRQFDFYSEPEVPTPPISKPSASIESPVKFTVPMNVPSVPVVPEEVASTMPLIPNPPPLTLPANTAADLEGPIIPVSTEGIPIRQPVISNNTEAALITINTEEEETEESLGFAPPPTKPTPPPSPFEIPSKGYFHVVAKGETLYRISQTYGTSVSELKKMNNLNSNIIEIGQQIRYR